MSCTIVDKTSVCRVEAETEIPWHVAESLGDTESLPSTSALIKNLEIYNKHSAITKTSRGMVSSSSRHNLFTYRSTFPRRCRTSLEMRS